MREIQQQLNQGEDIVNVNAAQQVAWIVYINGIEVPALSVSISYGVWRIPEAEVTMVPDASLQRLGAEDRLSVQVFYCDYWHKPTKPEFRLMFDGEVVSWSYINVARGRAVSFTCVDYIQIFTQLFFFFMSSVDDIAVGTSGEQIGVGISNVNTAGFEALYPYSLFSKGLISSGEGEGELITRPIEFIYNIIRGMIQADVPNRSVPASNFFAPWTRRTNFHRRFLALPFLEDPELDENGDPKAGVFPILRAVQADYAVAAVAKVTENVGTAGSIWQMLQQVFQTLMMEVAMIPTPSSFISDFETLIPKGPATFPDVTVKDVFLSNYFVKPQFLFGLPPTCNVFFPSQIRQLAYEENYATQPTRMYFNDEALQSFLNTDNDVSEGLGQLMRDALAVAYPEEVHIAARAAVESPAGDHGKNILVYPEEFYRGPVLDRRPLPRWFMFLMDAQKSTDIENTDTRGGAVLGDPARELYRKYAQHEYFKERYARRTGGVTLAFNPYPVPGFPCAVFDRRSTQVDVFGYVMTVRQVLTSKSWSTKLAFSYGRTFSEMFSLMHRQFTLENESNKINRATVAEKVKEGKQDEIEKDQGSIGAIATAPAEPIQGVRDVIQNFQRAEAFYRSTFFRARPPEASEISQRQLSAETNRRAFEEFISEEVSEGGEAGEEASERSREEQSRASRIESPPLGGTEVDQTRLDEDLRNKRAAFWYHEIIEFEGPEGELQGIKLEGIDTQSKKELLEILTKMKTGDASEEELRFAQSAVNRPTLGQNSGEEDDPGIIKELDSIEIAVRTASVSHNISGDKLIVPKAAASDLFKRYDAAMGYNSRPICTLDEYVYFLGEEATTEGRVDPGSALAERDSRSFPAHYYTRIRLYNPGPPENVPVNNITNTGAGGSQEGVQQHEDGSVKHEVSGLPEDFPQNRANWDAILMAYRRKVLDKLSPNR